MSPERWNRLEEVFQAALDLDASERAAYLDSACNGDASLRLGVEELLSQYHEAGDFIESPAVESTTMLTLMAGLADAPASGPLTGKRVGNWLTMEEIGRGGMGTVYRAVRDDGTFTQEVALKVVNRGISTPAVVNRFRRERQILAMLNHPNIARLLDGGSTSDGQPWFAMELIDGDPITKYCTDQRVRLSKRLTLFRDICHAVAHAHQNLIIHRDLKPANVLVTREGRVKLLDFGIAKIFQADFDDPVQTRPVVEALLTPEYAAPEQVRSEPVNTSTDVYALGLILYELLTGSKAQQLSSSSLKDVRRVVCQTEPRKPSEVELVGVVHNRARLRGDLDDIVRKALQKNPERRYASVAELAEDIERYLHGQPVRARSGSVLYRAGKFVRRNKLVVTAGLVTVLSLVIGIGAALWQARIAQEHFNSVRTLAKSLLTEINPAIENVPGSIRARHLIVQRSLEYLDKLSATQSRNVELLTELAEAYEAVATIQGNRNKANLGDYAGAMASFRKALAIRDRIEKISSSPANRSWIALIRAEAARTYPDSDEAVQLATSAVQVAEQLANDYPSRANNIVLANANFGLGYIHQMREEYEQAIPCFLKTRDIGIATKRSKNNISVCERYIASNYFALGNADAALLHARKGAELDELRLRDDPGPRASLDLSYDYQEMGRALQRLGKLDEALEMCRKAEKIRKDVAAADANNQRAVTSLAEINEILASLLAEMGKRKESLDYLDHAITARIGFVKAAPESAEDRYELARTYLIAGSVYRRFGLCQKADEALQHARATFTQQKKKRSLSEIDSVPACAINAATKRP